MPFTLAHPAAALPFHSIWRRGFLALALGTLGPDIPYFLPARIGDSLPGSHTALGAITVGAPLALVLLIGAVMARAWIVAPLWGRMRGALDRALLQVRGTPASWASAVPAAIIGSEIHVAWDSLTHKTGWMVLHVPLLSANLSPIDEHPFELFRALQYASSLVGLMLIGYWCRRRLAELPAANRPPSGWRCWALLTVLFGSIGMACNAAYHAGSRYTSFHGIEYIAATSALSSFVTLYLLLGAAITIARRARPAFSR